MKQEEIDALRARGALIQKSKEHFILRLRVTGGYAPAALLRAAANLAERFGDGAVHLSTRQAIELHNIPADAVPDTLACARELGLEGAGSGNTVRTVAACPGDPICRFSLGDTQELARQIHAKYQDYQGLPTKLKIAVTGCPNSCAKPQTNDIGIMAMGKTGYKIFVGGCVGRRPRWAIPLETPAPDADAVLRCIGATLDWLVRHGEPRERLAAVLERLGPQGLIDAIARALPRNAPASAPSDAAV